MQSKGLKSLLQHHSSKASILWCSALSIVQLSHPYMTTGKTIALTRWTFVGKVMSLLFNMLSRLVMGLIPRLGRSPGEGKGYPLQYSGEFHGLAGEFHGLCRPWGHKKLDTTEQLSLHFTRLLITFHPRSKRLLISWLQSPSAVILEPKKIKSDTVSTVSPSICHEMMGPDAMILVF